MASIETLAETLRDLAKSGMKPKELLAAVREKHSDASKKEVVRAAFYALIEGHEPNSKHMKDLHTFALGERGSDEDGERPSPKIRKKKKHKKEDRAVQQAN